MLDVVAAGDVRGRSEGEESSDRVLVVNGHVCRAKEEIMESSE